MPPAGVYRPIPAMGGEGRTIAEGRHSPMLGRPFALRQRDKAAGPVGADSQGQKGGPEEKQRRRSWSGMIGKRSAAPASSRKRRRKNGTTNAPFTASVPRCAQWGSALPATTWLFGWIMPLRPWPRRHSWGWSNGTTASKMPWLGRGPGKRRPRPIWTGLEKSGSRPATREKNTSRRPFPREKTWICLGPIPCINTSAWPLRPLAETSWPSG